MALGEFREVEGETGPAEFSGGIVLPLPLYLDVPNHPRDGYRTRILYTRTLTGPVVSAVEVSSQKRPVNGELLREVRVAEQGRDNLHRIARRYGRPVVPDEAEIATRVAAGPGSGQTLMLVKNLYEFAELTEQRPAKFVAETLGVSQATAGRWIRRSKDMLLWGDRGDD